MPTEFELNEFEEWKDSKKNTTDKVVQTINPTQFLLILVLIGIVCYFLFAPSYSNNQRIFMVVIVIVSAITIYYFFMQTKKDNLISEYQAKMIVQEALQNKVGTELEMGTNIQVGPHCKKRKWGDEWYKWEIQATIQKPSGVIKEKMVELDIYTGDIMGIVDMPTGYTGRDAPDIKPVFMYDYYTRAANGSK